MLFSILAVAVAVAASPLARNSLNPADFQKDVLAASNWYRGQHSANDFKWDDGVAASAQNWADRCSFNHESKYGENIAAGTFGSWDEVVNLWGKERKYYNWNNPGFSGATGHFTALVWKTTTSLGCGFKECPGNGITVVCRFSPPGNILGDNNKYFKDNVGEQVRGAITDVYEG